MNLSMRWLSDFVTLAPSLSSRDFSEAMTLSGSKVEVCQTEGAELSNIVVGQVISLERHPDSDHLWICSIDAGAQEPLQIVTGAQNLKAGDYVPVALDNSVIHGGKKIKKGKLRGVASNGMLCSLGELGLTLHDFPYAVEDGIFVLGEDCERIPGMDIHKAIGLDDISVEFEITSNRPDCLSVIGLAREAAATFQTPLRKHTPVVRPGEGDVNELLHVNIEEPALCYRYSGAVVKNVRVKPSPRWMRERLRASGVRPINNIVDITNYVMLEYGQPMHAFDLRYVDGGQIIPRLAREGESITTLDGVTRRLEPSMLVIADENKPVAVAGVMGGEYSGIMEDTDTIVFESACFNGASVRTTAKKLGMRTEASGRYEKELDPATTMPALLRALELVQMLDAGDVVNGTVDCNYAKTLPAALPFDPDWINRFIGIHLSGEEMKAILEKIEFKVENGQVTAPTFRNDIAHQADIAEEIARFYGYQNIPGTGLRGTANGSLTTKQKFFRTAEETLLACGLTEIMTYSFFSPKAYDKICLPDDSPLRRSVTISNPLGEDTSIMRTTALPSILEVLSRNYNNRNLCAAVYEIATEYLPGEKEELPLERHKAMLGMYGEGVDYYTLKGVVETLLEKLGISGYDVSICKENPSYHPGRTAMITVQGSPLAILGEIHPAVQENYEIGTKVYTAEIDMDTALMFTQPEKTYRPLPKFPAATRDFAFLCDAELPVLHLEQMIAQAVGPTLESIRLFDVYRGKQIPQDKKSVAFSVTMRSAERTLTDEEADGAMKRITKALAKENITLRS